MKLYYYLFIHLLIYLFCLLLDEYTTGMPCLKIVNVGQALIHQYENLKEKNI
jgi:hypothetical protein